MPIGYVVSVALVAVAAAFALRPPRPRRSSPLRLSFVSGFLVNELPNVAFVWLLASTLLALAQGDLAAPVGWAAFGLAVLTTIALVAIARRGFRTGEAVHRALPEGSGSALLAGHASNRPSFVRILIAPFIVRPRHIERIANISYGDGGRGNLLDVYRRRSRPSGGPVLIHLHGGTFRSGRKSNEARSLLYRLADQGWFCVSANYRLSPHATLADQLVDVKKVIAWVRRHGPKYGVDPGTLFLAGSSAGAHLAACAALTPNDPAGQPGFERIDTSVTAAICLYGYYGAVDGGSRPAAPEEYIGPDAPPFFVAHGDQDTIVIVDDARRFVDQLRRGSVNPVVYAELPGGQHVFDLFRTARFEAVIDGIEAFTAWVRSRRAPS